MPIRFFDHFPAPKSAHKSVFFDCDTHFEERELRLQRHDLALFLARIPDALRGVVKARHGKARRVS